MRKISWISLLIFLLAGLGLYMTVVRPFSTEINVVRQLSKAFLEDLQFKDFRASSLYHHALDMDRIDIGRAIEELFLVKPEFMDIMDFRISRAELDSSGGRARVVVTTRYRVLNKHKEPKEADIILYWIRRHPDCPQGASCEGDVCVDEFGTTLYQPEEGVDEERIRRSRDERKDEVRALSEKTYVCDPSLEEKWYMNLDSTLKHKDYR